jgi:D-2-hydroxyacid dehydrogenase (NADP+)
MNLDLKVGCDLFLDLKLYQVPQTHLEDLKRVYPNVHIEPINIRQGQPLPPADMEIYWGNRITPEIISSMPNLKWIHFGSVGVNRAQTKEVVDRNIIVTNSKDIMTGAVAATALSMMLALARGLHHCWRLRVEGSLTRESFDKYFDQTYELEDQTCLIIGFGQIGKRLATICKAMGMRVDVVCRSKASPPEEVSGKVFQMSELKQAVREADYVINLLPLTPLTTTVFDRQIFMAMKKTSFFINVGRGESVCEADLIEALKTGMIAGAGLDVFEKEPLAVTSELWKIPEVIITPHIGGLTNRYWEKQTKLFKENLRRYMRDDDLLNVVDMKKGY